METDLSALSAQEERERRGRIRLTDNGQQDGSLPNRFISKFSNAKFMLLKAYTENFGWAMPITCTFSLNNKSMSTLHCDDIGDFAAFSGDGPGKDNPADIAIPNVGPLPPGRYYIVDRGSGGAFTHLLDFFRTHLYGTDRSKWFALYNSTTQDDWVFVHNVKRGNFRLHPHGPRNLSQGCITLADPIVFDKLRARLIVSSPIAIPGGKGFAYGTVDVK